MEKKKANELIRKFELRLRAAEAELIARTNSDACDPEALERIAQDPELGSKLGSEPAAEERLAKLVGRDRLDHIEACAHCLAYLSALRSSDDRAEEVSILRFHAAEPGKSVAISRLKNAALGPGEEEGNLFNVVAGQLEGAQVALAGRRLVLKGLSRTRVEQFRAGTLVARQNGRSLAPDRLDANRGEAAFHLPLKSGVVEIVFIAAGSKS